MADQGGEHFHPRRNLHCQTDGFCPAPNEQVEYLDKEKIMSLPDNTCPRCLGGIPSDERRGQYPGAISRFDNETEVCSKCGQDEAMRQFTGNDLAWPIRYIDSPVDTVSITN